MGQVMTEREIATVLREVTDEEVVFYQDYEWGMMKQLVDPDFAKDLLRVGQAWKERRDQETGPGKPAAEEIEPYHSLMFSERMARNATWLVNRKRPKDVEIPLRYRIDLLLLTPRSSWVGLSSGFVSAWL